MVLSEMKELRAITSEDKALEFAARRSTEMVKGYCKIKEIPQELLGVCICIGLRLYDGEGYGKTENGSSGAVKSIREGQVSVSFQDEKNLQETDKNKILESFSTELTHFRKMSWEKEEN